MKCISGSLFLTILTVTLMATPGHANSPASLNGTLTPFLAKYELRAFAAAVAREGKFVAAGRTGDEYVTDRILLTLKINLAHIWLDPQQDMAIVTMTNVGGPKADQVLHALVSGLYRKQGRP